MHTFTFQLQVTDAITEEDFGRLYEGFPNEDVTVETGPRGHLIGFDREAGEFIDAVLPAIRDVLAMSFDVFAVQDELVSISDIASRTGRTRQSVSQIVNGDRAGGISRPLSLATCEAHSGTGRMWPAGSIRMRRTSRSELAPSRR